MARLGLIRAQAIVSVFTAIPKTIDTPFHIKWMPFRKDFELKSSTYRGYPLSELSCSSRSYPYQGHLEGCHDVPDATGAHIAR